MNLRARLYEMLYRCVRILMSNDSIKHLQETIGVLIRNVGTKKLINTFCSCEKWPEKCGGSHDKRTEHEISCRNSGAKTIYMYNILFSNFYFIIYSREKKYLLSFVAEIFEVYP